MQCLRVESRDPAIFKVLPPVTRTSDVILQSINIQVSVDVAIFISMKMLGQFARFFHTNSSNLHNTGRLLGSCSKSISELYHRFIYSSITGPSGHAHHVCDEDCGYVLTSRPGGSPREPLLEPSLRRLADHVHLDLELYQETSRGVDCVFSNPTEV